MLLFGGTAGAEELFDESYISTEELDAEISRRMADVERTRLRMQDLATQTESAVIELEAAEKSASRAEEIVTERAKVFYRLYRRGTAIKYLMGAESPVQLLKRFNQLKRLLEDGVAARQQASVRLESARANLHRIHEERAQAAQILTMLEQALSELQQQRAMREVATL